MLRWLPIDYGTSNWPISCLWRICLATTDGRPSSLFPSLHVVLSASAFRLFLGVAVLVGGDMVSSAAGCNVLILEVSRVVRSLGRSASGYSTTTSSYVAS